MTNNDLQNTTQKTEDRTIGTPLKATEPRFLFVKKFYGRHHLLNRYEISVS
jgi:hypothetical protein